MNRDNDAATAREIGELYGRMGAVEGEVKGLRTDIGEMHDDVAAIRSVVDQNRGGIRVMFSMMGVASATGAAITALGHWLLKGVR